MDFFIESKESEKNANYLRKVLQTLAVDVVVAANKLKAVYRSDFNMNSAITQ